MRLRLHPAASAEIDAAATWYELQREGLGQEFLAEVDRGLMAIAASSGTWALLADDPSVRRFVLARFPYRVLYDVAGGEVRVYAVAHTRRRPDFWRDRRSAGARTAYARV